MGNIGTAKPSNLVTAHGIFNNIGNLAWFCYCGGNDYAKRRVWLCDKQLHKRQRAE